MLSALDGEPATMMQRLRASTFVMALMAPAVLLAACAGTGATASPTGQAAPSAAVTSASDMASGSLGASPSASATASGSTGSASASPGASGGGSSGASGERAFVAIVPTGDDLVAGTAILTDLGSATSVEIIVADAGQNPRAADIRSGTCEAPDATVAYQLSPVTPTLTTEVTTGRSTTEVPVALDELLSGGFVIVIHASDDQASPVAACGAITA